MEKIKIPLTIYLVIDSIQYTISIVSHGPVYADLENYQNDYLQSYF